MRQSWWKTPWWRDRNPWEMWEYNGLPTEAVRQAGIFETALWLQNAFIHHQMFTYRQLAEARLAEQVADDLVRLTEEMGLYDE